MTPDDNDSRPQTYNIAPGPRMGVVTPEYLETVARVARKHKIPLLKFTEAQRLALIGHDPKAIPAIFAELGQAAGPKKPVGIHYIKSCPGQKWCRFGTQDSLALGGMLEAALMAMPLPAKTKVGVSGCAMNCCEGFVRDLGIFGKKEGWTLVFGGNGGGRPRFGDILGEKLSAEEVVALASRVLAYYAAHARPQERTARFMARTPLTEVQAAILHP